MEITNTLNAKNRSQWRRWLQKNYKKKKEVWLIYYKKASGIKRVSYNDAVEEALCFGWIDSIVKSIDDKKYAQRFSPRKKGRPFSQINKERLKKLIKEGKAIREVITNTRHIQGEKFDIPKDIMTAIKKNKAAWKNFGKFSNRYKRIRIAFIYGARERQGEFRKRLAYFIKMTEKGKQFGFGGIKHYF